MEKYDYTIKSNYLLFWNSHFSNWYGCEFILRSRKFNCVEQYMMYMKAKTFNDIESAKAIMKSNSPKNQKHLGRKVSNFDPKKWDKVKEHIVYDGCLAKYIQNEDLKQDIIKTDNLVLVEASPYDKVWGIGMSENDPDATNPSKWRGENLLGKALMKVRDTINNEKI